ncbi:hypothetical protein CVT24_010373 [Panaeolus cyanescens]|uniref:Uncharacterized protein n=1 Tax=Panaeolus cyanescens TaxID=181874 RepID=A0A409VAJ5_9AGAR|nr:hypothetical protein CVT24_010373 [Panaeolus cyanescens]
MSKTFQLNLRGYYTYGSWDVFSDDGQTELQATVNSETGVIYGFGQDNPGKFCITGVLVGGDLRFIKSYRGNTSASWKYVGRLISSAENDGIIRFAGGWGSPYGRRRDGQWVLAGVIECEYSATEAKSIFGRVEEGGYFDSSGLAPDASDAAQTRKARGASEGLSIQTSIRHAVDVPRPYNNISESLIRTLDGAFVST